MKKILVLFLIPLFLSGCDDLFDKGDVEKTYDGPTVVGFFPLQVTKSLAAAPLSTTIQVQLIGEQRNSDTAIAFSVDAASTAVLNTHYTIATPSPVTIAAGTSVANITINYIAGSVPSGEVRLLLNLEGGGGVNASENLKRSTIFIRP